MGLLSKIIIGFWTKCFAEIYMVDDSFSKRCWAESQRSVCPPFTLFREFELQSPTHLPTRGSSHVLDHLGAIFRNPSHETLHVFLSSGSQRISFMFVLLLSLSFGGDPQHGVTGGKHVPGAALLSQQAPTRRGEGVGR